MEEHIINLLILLIPCCAIVLIVYVIITNFFDNEEKRRTQELKKTLGVENSKTLLPIRLQAYERLILYLERTHPNNLLQRVSGHQISVSEYREILVRTIRSEFEYNLSQQLYISNESWKIAITAKDQVIQLIHQIAMKLPNDVSGIELSKALFSYIFETNENEFPTNVAIEFIKEDVKTLF
jgi:hypothetical protein